MEVKKCCQQWEQESNRKQDRHGKQHASSSSFSLPEPLLCFLLAGSGREGRSTLKCGLQNPRYRIAEQGYRRESVLIPSSLGLVPMQSMASCVFCMPGECWMSDLLNVILSGARFDCIPLKSVVLFFWHVVKSPVDQSESFEACSASLLWRAKSSLYF